MPDKWVRPGGRRLGSPRLGSPRLVTPRLASLRKERPEPIFWQKAEESKIRKANEKGFAPLTVGLILATCLVMSRAADRDWRAYAVTVICTVIFMKTKINPLIVVAAAGVLGYLGVM